MFQHVCCASNVAQSVLQHVRYLYTITSIQNLYSLKPWDPADAGTQSACFKMNVRIANDRKHMMRIIGRSETHQHVGTPVRLAVWQTADEILLRVRKAVCIQTFSIKQS